MRTIFGHDTPLPDNNEPVHFMDAVMGLGRTHRFGGNCNMEWMVLHHSMLAALVWLKYYGAEGVEHALLHDLHEYITGDIPTPVKIAIGREAVDKMQDEMDVRVYDTLAIGQPDNADARCVRFVDSACLFIEAAYIGAKDHVEHLIHESIAGWNREYRAHVWDIVKKTFPDVAQRMLNGGFFTAPIRGEPVHPMCQCRHQHSKEESCPVPDCSCTGWHPVGDCGGSCCCG